MASYGEQEEYYAEGDGQYVEGQPGTENFGDEDFENMEEVERALEAQGLNQYGRRDEDMAAMAELEAAMDQHQENSANVASSNSHGAGGSGAATTHSRAVIPEGAMPSRNGVLSSAAAEFWFPECRNCPCCNGFKHGCSCRSNGVDTCTHPECVDPSHTASVRARVAASPPASAPSGPISHGNPSPRPSPSFAPPRGPPTGGDEASVPCKFWSSPMGCRFGSTCRNSHLGPSGNGGQAGGYQPPMAQAYPPRAYPPQPGMSQPQGGGAGPCIFFAQGSCRFGTACRFSHA